MKKLNLFILLTSSVMLLVSCGQATKDVCVGAENPGKVNAVYIDNPLLDMKSWPCGLGKGNSSRQELEAFKKDYNITSDEQLREFKNSPIIDFILNATKFNL